MEPVRKDNLAAFDGNLVEPRAGRIQQNNHYLHPTNPTNAFERRYTESETTSGSESGEIAFLGGLEDVFDPVDELLPAMAEDIIREIDEGITGCCRLQRASQYQLERQALTEIYMMLIKLLWIKHPSTMAVRPMASRTCSISASESIASTSSPLQPAVTSYHKQCMKPTKTTRTSCSKHL